MDQVYGRTERAVIGSMVRVYRIHRGLTQMELAKQTHMHQTVLSQIERGVYQYVTTQQLRNCARVLGTNIKAFLPVDLTEATTPHEQTKRWYQRMYTSLRSFFVGVIVWYVLGTCVVPGEALAQSCSSYPNPNGSGGICISCCTGVTCNVVCS